MSADAQAASDRKIADIEVLRACAILFVMAEHVRDSLLTPPFAVPFVGKHVGFWAGVDLFLVISGFVIARTFLPAIQQVRTGGDFRAVAGSFWLRRAFRLLPSAWLWIGITLLLVFNFNRAGQFGGAAVNLSAAAAALLYYANWHFLTIFLEHQRTATFHYWSLSLEEQFYVLLPFLAVFFRSRLGWLLAVACLTQLLARLYGGPVAGLYLLVFRTDALFLGVGLAMWKESRLYARLDPLAFRRSMFPGLMLLSVVMSLIAFASGDLVKQALGLSTIALLAAVLVWIASYDRDYLFPSGAVKRLLMWVGSRSYGIYLIHVPVYLAVRELLLRVDPSLLSPGRPQCIFALFLATVLIVTLAELNFRLLETPLRRLGASISRRMTASVGAPLRVPAG